MSKSSIYETKWTDLVFENKNKEYGAYQLRQENTKTTVTALFMGLLLFTALGSVPVIINALRTPDAAPSIPEIPLTDPVITVKLDLPHDTPPAPPVQQQTAPAQADVPQFVNPVVVATAQATQDVPTNASIQPVVDNAGTGTGPAVVNAMPGGSGGDGESLAPPVVDNTPVIAAALDKMPEYPGGIQNFYNYVGKNFARPDLDEERTLQVYVSFVIEKDGSLTDIMVRKDPGFGMGKEAIRVLKSLKTKWAPGILNGKAVRTAYNLPITIKTQPE